MQNRRSSDINPFKSITSILGLVLVLVAIYWLVKGAFTILSWVAPVLLIITAIIDHKVIIDYVKWVWNLLKTQVLMGIGALLLTVFGFPVIAGFLLAKALLRRKVKQVSTQMEQTREGEFVEFEEVASETQMPMELPPIEPTPRAKPKPEPRREKNDYEDLFE